MDLDWEWVGSTEVLEYKECLLFVLRSSLGNCLGGFVSNYLIEEEVREDKHAFMFSLAAGGFKLRVREEHSKEAY